MTVANDHWARRNLVTGAPGSAGRIRSESRMIEEKERKGDGNLLGSVPMLIPATVAESRQRANRSEANSEMNSPPQYRLFVVLCLVSLALWRRTLVATVELALQNDGYTHILLILPISISLIFLGWKSRKAYAEPNFLIAFTLMLAAILMGFAGGIWWAADSLAADARLTLGMAAVVTWWIGSFVGSFGTRVSRMFVFPLCFLLWLVPLPQFALTHIVTFLQQGSADAARLLFAIARVPVTQDGVLLSIPGLTIEVAQECSSVRSSLMLLVTTMVLAHLLLRSDWGKALVILTAIPLSLAKNGLRIFTISMLGAYVDPSFLHGWLHHHGGIRVLSGISGKPCSPCSGSLGGQSANRRLHRCVTELAFSIAAVKPNIQQLSAIAGPIRPK